MLSSGVTGQTNVPNANNLSLAKGEQESHTVGAGKGSAGRGSGLPENSCIHFSLLKKERRSNRGAQFPNAVGKVGTSGAL